MNQEMSFYAACGISEEVFNYTGKIWDSLSERFERIDRISECNQLKVLEAMQTCRVAENCLYPSSGYGYNDVGRDALEQVYARIFHTEDALVRPAIVCGTHAIATALAGNLRPGDVLYSPAGKPYDTLEEVIGIRPSKGSFAEYGITYKQTDLLPDGSFDYDSIRRDFPDKTKVVMIQRSKGYQTRPSFTIEKIRELIAFIRNLRKDVIVFVDNCYGEFVETEEPTDAGADLIAGSLIKNPGGGLAALGGYIAGRKEYVENAAFRLTTPGLGKEVGASVGNTNKDAFQGLFLSPSVTASALKAAVFASAIYESLGFETVPRAGEERTDIIQSVVFRNEKAMIAFCQGIQQAAPVDSFVSCEPWAMPGYDSDVIMAAGAFVSGSSIELSADGPVIPPYAVYFQGGLTWQHGKFGIIKTVQALCDAGVIRKEDLI